MQQLIKVSRAFICKIDPESKLNTKRRKLQFDEYNPSLFPSVSIKNA